MTVKELIIELEKLPEYKIVVLTEPNGIKWDNIGRVIEDIGEIRIQMEGSGLFQES